MENTSYLHRSYLWDSPFLDVRYHSDAQKQKGKDFGSEFSISEGLKTQRELLPEFDLGWLFAVDREEER